MSLNSARPSDLRALRASEMGFPDWSLRTGIGTNRLNLMRGDHYKMTNRRLYITAELCNSLIINMIKC